MQVMEKIQTKKYIKDQMPKSQMFVIITHIYKIARDFLDKTHSELPLYAFVYDYIMNKYGIKKIAEKKFRQLCATIKRMKDSNTRAFLFGRFMGFFQQLERKDFGLYTDMKEQIYNLNIGFMPNNIDSEQAHFVPYIRVTKYLSSNYEGN